MYQTQNLDITCENGLENLRYRCHKSFQEFMDVILEISKVRAGNTVSQDLRNKRDRIYSEFNDSMMQMIAIQESENFNKSLRVPELESINF